MSDAPDPYAGGGSTPALSFRDQPVGTSYEGTITHIEAELVHSINFESREPDYWPASKDGKPGGPKLAAVMHVKVNGEERSVWATKPSALFTAFSEARQKSIEATGNPLEVGGTIRITHVSSKPAQGGAHLSAQKIYQVDYRPPVAAPVDPWASTTPDPSTSAGQPWADAGPASGAGTAATSDAPKGGPTPEMIAAAKALLAESGQ